MAELVHDGVARATLLDLVANPRSSGNGRRAVVKLAVAQVIYHVTGVAVMIDQPGDLQHGDVAVGVGVGIGVRGCCRTDRKRRQQNPSKDVRDGGHRTRLASKTERRGFNSANSVNLPPAIPARERSSVKRIVYSVLAASAVAAAMTGCSASEIVNTGGDTKCKDFLTQDEKKQNDEVSKMLKDKSGQDPTNLEITATKGSVVIYCQVLGKEDTKISEAPHG